VNNEQLIDNLNSQLESLHSDMAVIHKYSSKLEELNKGVNTLLAPIYLRDFIVAYDVATNLFARASYIQSKADHLVDMAKAEAYLDKSVEALKNRNIKDTVDAKNHFVSMDLEVGHAKDLKARADAMSAILKNKIVGFKMALETVKKMAYAGDYSNSPNEGM